MSIPETCGTKHSPREAGEQTEQTAKAAFQGVSATRFSSINICHRGRLPHWEKECGLYFVTFRTADSLPKERFSELRVELRKSGKPYRISQRQYEELLKRSGSLWQREYYDRLIRDADELSRAVSHVVRNPENAKLTNWRWFENRAQDAPETAAGSPALPWRREFS